MDASALYYTFSTIAQTLAAGLAVLAAFLLYRLQGIENSLAHANATFERHKQYISVQDVWNCLLNDGFASLDERMMQIEKDRNIAFYSRNTWEEPSMLVIFWWPIFLTTRRWVRIALIITIVDIATCFIAMPYVPEIIRYPKIYQALCATVIILGMFALLTYAKLIFLLVSPAKYNPLEK